MENLNQKSWLSENAKSILIVVGFIVLWIILRILGLIFKWWPLYFLLHGLNDDIPYEGKENNSVIVQNPEKNKATFEKKEQCMKYFDKYRDYLKENREHESTESKYYIMDYEMFYNSDLDTCISAYSIFGNLITEKGRFPSYNFFIVDYLNGEKKLYHCFEDTYMEYLEGIETKGGLECGNEFDIIKEKYKE